MGFFSTVFGGGSSGKKRRPNRTIRKLGGLSSRAQKIVIKEKRAYNRTKNTGWIPTGKYKGRW